MATLQLDEETMAEVADVPAVSSSKRNGSGVGEQDFPHLQAGKAIPRGPGAKECFSLPEDQV